MPCGVRRMYESPIVAKASGRERVERGTIERRRDRGGAFGRRDRNPLYATADPPAWRPVPHRAGALGRAGLASGSSRGHQDSATKAHSRRSDLAESCIAPVPLQLMLRVRRVEALDARAEAGADVTPLLGDDTSEERQTDSCVEPPRPSERSARNGELDHRDAAPRLHHARELAHRRGGIVDIAQ